VALLFNHSVFKSLRDTPAQHRLYILPCILSISSPPPVTPSHHDSYLRGKGGPSSFTSTWQPSPRAALGCSLVCLPTSTGTYKHHQPRRAPCVTSRLLLASPCHCVAWCWAVADRAPARHSLNRPILPARRDSHLATTRFVSNDSAMLTDNLRTLVPCHRHRPSCQARHPAGPS
jgi:hypothetical protein